MRSRLSWILCVLSLSAALTGCGGGNGGGSGGSTPKIETAAPSAAMEA